MPSTETHTREPSVTISVENENNVVEAPSEETGFLEEDAVVKAPEELQEEDATPQNAECWWGAFELDENDVGCWRIGPSSLWIQRLKQEWRVIHKQDSDIWNSAAGADFSISLAEDMSQVIHRFMFRQTSEKLHMVPTLADRPIIVKPKMPLAIEAGEEVVMYLSTPVWIRIKVADAKKPLREIPSFRLSDTWLESSLQEGELCYASRSAAQLELVELPHLPYRVVSPVKIRNRSKTELTVKRIRLPVAYLSLYKSADNRLWTQTVTLEQKGDSSLIKLGTGAPPAAEGGELVGKPRVRLLKNPWARLVSLVTRETRLEIRGKQ